MLKGQKHSEEAKEKNRLAHLGYTPVTAWKKGRIPWNKGKKMSDQHRERVRQANLGKKYSKEVNLKKGSLGQSNGNYIDGTSKFTVSHYKSQQYKLWRNSVFERDNFTCQDCGAKDVYLEAHHIKGWAQYPELRFDLENGKTLCKECHKRTDNYKGKGKRKLIHITV